MSRMLRSGIPGRSRAMVPGARFRPQAMEMASVLTGNDLVLVAGAGNSVKSPATLAEFDPAKTEGARHR